MNCDIEKYLSKIPSHRRDRIIVILKAFIKARPEALTSMKYKMPTLEKGSNWASVGNQKNYISVYFCNEKIIKNIIEKHPGINTGKGCVRIKDKEKIPIEDLIVSFNKAMNFK